MSIIGLWIDNINSKRIENLIKDKYLKVAHELMVNIENKEKTDAIVNKYELRPLDVPKEIEVLHKEKHTFGYVVIGKKSFDDEFIIEVKYLDEMLIYKTHDEENINDKQMLNILIFVDILLLILIFLYIIKLLSPLKGIALTMESFSKGNLNSRIHVKSNDEIGVLSTSFNQMAANLENLIKTREELLRDIGHELRTPIAKGKFAIEKIDDFSQKELLKRIFMDLELLTNDLIELEKLNSNKLNFTKFSVETLVLESLQRVHVKNESDIQIDIVDNRTLQGDIYYLSIAVKNLIDNALKYSNTFPIIIESKNNRLSVMSYGEKLSKEFEYYLKPFTQELAQRDGFGLGLSIVNKIIKKHQWHMVYEHRDGKNIFSIQMD